MPHLVVLSQTVRVECMYGDLGKWVLRNSPFNLWPWNFQGHLRSLNRHGLSGYLWLPISYPSMNLSWTVFEINCHFGRKSHNFPTRVFNAQLGLRVFWWILSSGDARKKARRVPCRWTSLTVSSFVYTAIQRPCGCVTEPASRHTWCSAINPTM